MSERKKSKAARLFREANRLSDRGELEAALERYEAVLSLDPQFQDAHVALAYIRHRLGLVDEAEASLRCAIELGEHPIALYNLGWILNERGEFKEAIQCLERSLRIASNFVPALKELGAAWLRLADYDAAERSFRKVLEIDAADNDARLGMKSLPRFREYPMPFPGGTPGMKEEVYLRLGAMCLGADTDDGIEVPNYIFHNFDGPSTIAVPLARFLDHAREWGWRFDRLAVLDPESEPLATALSAALRVPVRADNPARGDFVLLVCAVLRDEKAYCAARRAIKASGGKPFALVLGLDPDVEIRVSEEPQVVGILSPTSVFWNRSESFSRVRVVKDEKTGEVSNVITDPPRIDDRPADVIGREVFEAVRKLQETPRDLARERLFYGTEHTLLNFDLRGVGRARARRR